MTMSEPIQGRPQQVYQDQWSFLDYKPTFTDKVRPQGGTWAPPNWVGTHWRRICAYMFLDHYYKNISRCLLPPDAEQDIKENRREYGDPFVLVESVRSSVMGSEQAIDVEGLHDDDSELKSNAEVQKDLLDEWADKERLPAKMIETERNTIKLGDGVYVVGWDEKKKRPRLRCYDPGFYFPVLKNFTPEEEFPDKVHFAWEFEEMRDGKMQKFLWRMTYEIRQGEAVTHPWNDEPTNDHCWREVLQWKQGDVDGTDIDNISRTHAETIEEANDIGFDFMPVVHIPNTVAEEDHYGVALISPGLQILDDIQSADSDMNAAAATTGAPVIGLQGGTLKRGEDQETVSYRPGSVMETGDGKLDMLDTSNGLKALIDYDDHLLDRASVNLRVPNTMLGRVDPSKVPSGIVLTLSFQPHSNMVREMRLVRDHKYRLLLRFVSRMYQENGKLEVVNEASIKFGSYLPADKQEVTGMVSNLLANHAISIETAVQMLVEAGMPIADAAQEVQRIQKQNLDDATKLLDATGDANLVRDRLDLPPVSAEEAQTAQAGGATGQGPAANLPEPPPEIPPLPGDLEDIFP
jgi:hypothetical protein